MSQNWQRLTTILSIILVVNVFASKAALLGMYMGTYVNIAVSVIIGVPLLTTVLRAGYHRPRRQSRVFSIVLAATLVLLLIQMLLRELSVVQAGGYLATSVLFLVFGLAIPRTLPLQRFLAILRTVMWIVLLSSLALLLLDAQSVTQGGRFAGIFRDSILFSQVALIGSVLFGVRLVVSGSREALAGFVAFLAGAVMSGSRVAFLTALVSVLIAYFVVRRPNFRLDTRGRVLAVIAVIALTPIWVSAASRIATGEVGFGARVNITNGLADRQMHWQLGIDRILQAPVIGDGLLTKYKSGDGVALSNFDESRDPHNLFVYAGQVGGIPLLALSVVAMTLLSVAAIRALRQPEGAIQIVGGLVLLYILSSVVGGSLISLGSMMDRLFWLFVGYLALRARPSHLVPTQGSDGAMPAYAHHPPIKPTAD